MSDFNFIGFDNSELKKLLADFTAISSLPDAVMKEMVTAKAKIVMKEQKRVGAMDLQGPYAQSPVATVQRMAVNKPRKNKKDGWYAQITFRGSQHGTRNAEVAFVNEFGRSGFTAHGVHHDKPFRPRGWIRKANKIADEPGEKAAKEVLYRFFKSHNL